MNVPIIVVIAWSFAIGVLLMSWFYRGLRIIDLEGKLAEWEGDDDGPPLAELYERAFGHPPVPTSAAVPFGVASRAELFGSVVGTFGVPPPQRLCDRCGLDEHGGECIR